MRFGLFPCHRHYSKRSAARVRRRVILVDYQDAAHQHLTVRANRLASAEHCLVHFRRRWLMAYPPFRPVCWSMVLPHVAHDARRTGGVMFMRRHSATSPCVVILAGADSDPLARLRHDQCAFG